MFRHLESNLGQKHQGIFYKDAHRIHNHVSLSKLSNFSLCTNTGHGHTVISHLFLDYETISARCKLQRTETHRQGCEHEDSIAELLEVRGEI